MSKATDFGKQFQLKTGVKEIGAIKAPSQTEVEYLRRTDGAPTLSDEAFSKLDMIMKLGSLALSLLIARAQRSSLTSTYFRHRGQSCCKHPTSLSDVARAYELAEKHLC